MVNSADSLNRIIALSFRSRGFDLLNTLNQYPLSLASFLQILINLGSRVGHLYFKLGMLDEAAFWSERAYQNRELELVYPFWPGRGVLDQKSSDHPAMQAFPNKPELIELFEIRRRNAAILEKQ